MSRFTESESFKIPFLADSQHKPRADMGWVYTPSIWSRQGNRRITGNDLVLVQAIVSQNEQTWDELQSLPGSDVPSPSRSVTHDDMLDRMNNLLDGWLRRQIHVASETLQNASVVARILAEAPMRKAARNAGSAAGASKHSSRRKSRPITSALK